MSRSPDIIEAVPQSEKRRYSRNKKLMFAGLGTMGAGVASFLLV